MGAATAATGFPCVRRASHNNIHSCMYPVKQAGGSRPRMKTAPAPKSMYAPKSARISKQKARTEATRGRLLEAAERVFVRDGFEAARLEDIAAGAGYTRGAFYANFESKEDIFFALLEHWVSGRIEQINSLLRQHATTAKGVRALRQHYAQLAKNRSLALLSLEFKLFAIRHPQAH